VVAAGALSRRGVLGAGGAVLGAVLAGCGGGGETVTDVESPEVRHADAGVLDASLGLERAAVAAHAAAAAGLRGTDRALLARIGAHERVHAAFLARTIRRLGRRPTGRAPGYAVPRGAGRTGLLGLSERVEREGLAEYLDALPKLSSPALRGDISAILTVRAEQLAAIRSALGRPPAPDPLPGAVR
jgi:hypothetical protein